MSELVLTIDVGNTRTKCGLFERSPRGMPRSRALTAFVAGSPGCSVAGILQWIGSLDVRPSPATAVIAGSDPEARDRLVADWPVDTLPVRLVDSPCELGVQLEVDVPHKVGIDRVLNALAVTQLLPRADGFVVVDSGTATTIDLVAAGPVFHGGAILPGIRLSARALHDYTARLPLLNVDVLLDSVPPLPARNTEDAMLAGLLFGHLGAVREVVYRMCEAATELAGGTGDTRIVLTGGGGRFLQDYLPTAEYIDCLALYALAALRESAGRKA